MTLDKRKQNGFRSSAIKLLFYNSLRLFTGSHPMKTLVIVDWQQIFFFSDRRNKLYWWSNISLFLQTFFCGHFSGLPLFQVNKYLNTRFGIEYQCLE